MLERDRQSVEARRWVDAATEVRDKAFETGVGGDAARTLGKETVDRGRSVMGKFSSGIAERAFRQRGGDYKAE